MTQLLVRDLEEAVVRRLQAEAARENVSLEEAHRRVLRRALLSDTNGQPGSLKRRLLEMPLADEDAVFFERVRTPPRPPVDLEG